MTLTFTSAAPAAAETRLAAAGAAVNVAAIGFGSIRHRRARPVTHQFAYRAFFVRLPLRALAAQRWPWRRMRRNGAGWFAFNHRDHGDGADPVAWAERLLASAGVNDATGEIWLHTFPRMLGYVFNPVSFWLCERADGHVRAVICEVNNTFGERHFYLLAHADGRPLSYGETLRADKALHVSPFCRVQGGYRFRFLLARRADGDRFVARVDYLNQANDANALLETSIEGRLEPLTDRALGRALLRFPAFTFGVIARIHWQAVRLWIKRVPFFSKPSAPAAALTRMH